MMSTRSAAVPTILVGGFVLIGAVLFGLLTFASTRTYESWAPLLIFPVLALLTLPVAHAIARADEDRLMVRIIMLAVVFNLLASLVRFYVAFEVYGGSADAAKYLDRGWGYAQQIRLGNLVYDRPAGGGDGTHFIRQVTGFVLAVIGYTPVGAFLVFSWFSFWGLSFFYRAFTIAVPLGDRRRYAYLVFFLPSLLFWPSSVGKEAWMLMTLGLAAYGVALMLNQRAVGYLWMTLGMWGTAVVRPHVTALVAAALAAGFLLRRSTGFGKLTKLIGAVVVVAALLLAVRAAEGKFNVEGQGLSGVEQAIDDTAEQTSKGGSEYDAQRPESVADIPLAVFTVMFRPLPHEAHNMQALFTSLEGVFLLALVVLSRRRLYGAMRAAWKNPYVAFAAVYSLLFMLAFSSFGNFGILARQRAQLLPFVIVLLAMPDPRVLVRRQAEQRRTTPFARQRAET